MLEDEVASWMYDAFVRVILVLVDAALAPVLVREADVMHLEESLTPTSSVGP